MTATTTYTGICQACGRRQAIHIHTGKIAKHGYTTDWGFFNGTCQGSDHAALEQETELNLDIVKQLGTLAAGLDAEAAGDINTVSVEVGRQIVRGRRVPEYRVMNRAEFEATQPAYRKFDDAVELVRTRLRRQAEAFRAHAADLDKLRDQVHGQPLAERPQEAPIQRETFKNYREAYARVEALKAEGIKAQSRRQGYSQIHTVTYRKEA